MVLNFDIVISRAAAEAMNHELSNFLKACAATRKAELEYRYAEPSPDAALELCRWENRRNEAALNLARLVLEHVVDPYFK